MVIPNLIKPSLLLASLFLSIFHSFGQSRELAFEVNEKLGRGINYGNMFEAPSESAWGNPYMADYPAIIAELGFDHVRIPIRWEPSDRSAENSPYTISPTFLARIKEVVDEALENDLMVIINMHHHEELFEDPDDQKARFLAQWEQISEYFKDYNENLLFEILNEPHGGITPEKWNIFIKDALETIRPESPNRIVLIGTAEFGGLSGLSQLEIPDDENIILTIHYYNPFTFTHQGADWVGEHADDWLGTEWNDTDLDREIVENEMAPLISFGENQNIPVHIGEFGAYSTADIDSRERWTTYLARYFEELQWSWAYWEFSAGFGIYDPSNETFNQPLIDALLSNPMPEPNTYDRISIYESNFSSGADGWQLNTQGGASAQLTSDNNELNVSISQTGSETWHVQLVKTGLSLQSDKKYAASVTLKAEESRDFNWSIGMSVSPWSSYSSSGGTLNETSNSFSMVFDMNTTDNTARIAFDLGSSATNVTIESVKLEELQLSSGHMEAILRVLDQKSVLYPNPVYNTLTIDNQANYEIIEIHNIKGQLMLKESLNEGSSHLNINDLKSGIYFVSLIKSGQKLTQKLLKKE